MPGKTFRQKPRSKNNKKSKKNHSNNKKSRKQLKGGMKKIGDFSWVKANREKTEAAKKKEHGFFAMSQPSYNPIDKQLEGNMNVQEIINDPNYNPNQEYNKNPPLPPISVWPSYNSNSLQSNSNANANVFTENRGIFTGNPASDSVHAQITNAFKNNETFFPRGNEMVIGDNSQGYRDRASTVEMGSSSIPSSSNSSPSSTPSPSSQFGLNNAILSDLENMSMSGSKKAANPVAKMVTEVDSPLYGDDDFSKEAVDYRVEKNLKKLRDLEMAEKEEDNLNMNKYYFIEEAKVFGEYLSTYSRVESKPADGVSLNLQHEERLVFPGLSVNQAYPIEYYPDSKMLAYVIINKKMDKFLQDFDKLLKTDHHELTSDIMENVRNNIIIADDNGNLRKNEKGNTVIYSHVCFCKGVFTQLYKRHIVSFEEYLLKNPVERYRRDLVEDKRKKEKIRAAHKERYDDDNRILVNMGLEVPAYVPLTDNEVDEMIKNYSPRDVHAMRYHNIPGRGYNLTETALESISPARKTSASISPARKTSASISSARMPSASISSARMPSASISSSSKEVVSTEVTEDDIKKVVYSMIRRTIDVMTTPVYLGSRGSPDIYILKQYVYALTKEIHDEIEEKIKNYNLDSIVKIEEILKTKIRDGRKYRKIYSTLLNERNKILSDKNNKESSRIGELTKRSREELTFKLSNQEIKEIIPDKPVRQYSVQENIKFWKDYNTQQMLDRLVKAVNEY